MIRWFCRAQNVNFATIDIEACPLSSELIMAVPCFTVYEPPQGRAALANVQTLAHTCRARELDDVVVEFAGENPEHLMTAVSRALLLPADIISTMDDLITAVEDIAAVRFLALSKPIQA